MSSANLAKLTGMLQLIDNKIWTVWVTYCTERTKRVGMNTCLVTPLASLCLSVYICVLLCACFSIHFIHIHIVNKTCICVVYTCVYLLLGIGPVETDRPWWMGLQSWVFLVPRDYVWSCFQFAIGR